MTCQCKKVIKGRKSFHVKDWRQEEKGTTEDEMAGWHHPAQWTRVWAGSGRWWRTGKPGVLQSMGSQRPRQAWATEQQQQCEKNSKPSQGIHSPTLTSESPALLSRSIPTLCHRELKMPCLWTTSPSTWNALSFFSHCKCDLKVTSSLRILLMIFSVRTFRWTFFFFLAWQHFLLYYCKACISFFLVLEDFCGNPVTQKQCSCGKMCFEFRTTGFRMNFEETVSL